MLMPKGILVEILGCFFFYFFFYPSLFSFHVSSRLFSSLFDKENLMSYI